MADLTGVYVIDTDGVRVDLNFEWDADLRSRLRHATTFITWSAQTHDWVDEAEEMICDAGRCCPYSLKRVGMEYEPWRIQPDHNMV